MYEAETCQLWVFFMPKTRVCRLRESICLSLVDIYFQSSDIALESHAFTASPCSSPLRR